MVKKKEIRSLMKKKRSELSKPETEYLGRAIAVRAYSFIKENRYDKAAIYMSINNEVKIEYLLDLDIDNKIDFFLPQCNGDRVFFNRYNGSGSLIRDDFGILCQADGEVANLNDINIFFVPGLAFDLSGNRVGYGKGCYDRALSMTDKPVLVGVCYDFQVLRDDRIEFDGFDINMHYLLTENGFIECKPEDRRNYNIKEKL